MQRFDLNTLPQSGRHLIEASAGTGKTHNLMALAIRALGLQGAAPDELVLMTFTRASTRELRARLRRALTEAMADTDDPVLRGQFSQALRQLHQITVLTIHGFALQVIQSLGPSVGIHPRPMNESTDEVLLDAALDTYRALEKEDRSGLLSATLGSMAAFSEAAQAVMNHHDLWVPDGLDAPDLALTFEEFQARLTEVSTTQEDLAALPGAQRKSVLQYAEACLSATHPGNVSKPAMDYFGKKWKESSHPLWRKWLDLEAPTETQVAFRAYALRRVEARVAELLTHRGEMHPDQILKDAASVATAVALAQKPKHRVILVDEFQDTDRAQWTLLDALYPDTPLRLMVLVGDPKQAIYRFRGADTRFYYTVRNTLPVDHRWMLDTNYRSAETVVEGLNQLYHPDHSIGQALECVAMQTGQKDCAPLSLDGVDLPAFQWCPSLRANEVATLVAALSALGAEGKLRIGDTPVCPGDITVLVSRWSQASGIQDAGMAAGVQFHFADQQSVFNHPFCREMVAVLYALANPDDLQSVSTAAVTELIGLPLTGEGLLIEQAEFIEWQNQITEARMRWYREGPSAAIEMLLAHCQTFARQPKRMDGLRRVMALTQCLEVFGAEAKGLSPLEAALWWSHRATDAGKASEQEKPRAPSKKEVATITTVHGAKGLEYPIVILAGEFNLKTPKDSAFSQSYSSDKGLVLDFTTAGIAKAAEDLKQDGLRLLYVALTRAKHAIFLAEPGEQSLVHELLDNRPIDALSPDHARAEWLQTPLHRSVRFSPRIESSTPLVRPTPATWFIRSFSSLTRHAHLSDEPTRAQDETELLPDPSPSESSWHGIPGGTETGNFVHAMLEHRARKATHPISIASQVSLHWPSHLSRHHEPAMVNWLSAIEKHPLPGGACIADLTAQQLRPEPQFQMQFKAGLTQATFFESFKQLPWWSDALPLQSLTLRGQLTGFIDLVYEHEGRFYVLDYKTNRLGHRDHDYHPEALCHAMSASHYHSQAAIYSVALHRWLAQRLPHYDPSMHLGEVVYLFCRGLNGPSQGIWSAPISADAVQEISTRCFDASHH